MSVTHSDVRVLICDAQPLVRTGLRAILETHAAIEVVGEAGATNQVAPAARWSGAGVVLMPISLPAAGGVHATRLLAGPDGAPGASVVLMADPGQEDAVLAGVQAGARGFVSTWAGAPELIGAVLSVAAGQAYVSPAPARVLLDWLTSRLPGVAAREGAPPEALTGRERQVLRLLGQGCSNAEIAHQLGIREPTVRCHIHHILAKLGVRSRTEAALLSFQYCV